MQADVCWAIKVLDYERMADTEGMMYDRTAPLLNGIAVNLNSDAAAVLFMT